jgi:hypothetical protein
MNRNLAEVYKPGKQDGVNGRGQIGTQEAPWAEGWFANLRHISQAGANYTATADLTFTDSKASVAIYTVNPNGANRNFTPSGAFRDRAFIIVLNTGSDFNVTFVATGLNGRILPGKTGMFIYNGTSAVWQRMLF